MGTIRGRGLFLARFLAPEPPFESLDGLAGLDVPFASRRGSRPTASAIGAARRSRELGPRAPSPLRRIRLVAEEPCTDPFAVPVHGPGDREGESGRPRVRPRRRARKRGGARRRDTLVLGLARAASGGRAPVTVTE